jgi:hypothetical protein
MNSIEHADVAPSGNKKTMKTFFITTGFFIAYKNTFDVNIYSL